MDYDATWIRFGLCVLAVAALVWLITYDDRDGGTFA